MVVTPRDPKVTARVSFYMDGRYITSMISQKEEPSPIILREITDRVGHNVFNRTLKFLRLVRDSSHAANSSDLLPSSPFDLCLPISC